MRAYKYYSLQRPVSIGTYPKQGMIEFKNYDERMYVPEICRKAWGELWYERRLENDEAWSYDLLESPWNED